ncbi:MULTISPECIES: hypothetical protein [Halomonas]|uniref:hypothetical protein n=1 Tax=Halomonas TaxID=2745 RepID=UPI003CE9CA23
MSNESLPDVINDPLSSESISTSALTAREGLHIRTLKRRWSEGLRGKELITSQDTIYVNDPNTGESISLPGLALRYDLSVDAVRIRFHNGLRGKKLIELPKSKKAQAHQGAPEKKVLWQYSLNNESHIQDVQALQKKAKEMLLDLRGSRQGYWLTTQLIPKRKD